MVIRNPQSAIRNPQSAIRNPQSAIQPNLKKPDKKSGNPKSRHTAFAKWFSQN
jgi:hypothetical protein